MKQFMPELMPKERLNILEQNADSIEETTYQKPLTEEALADKKDVLTTNSIELYDLDEQKKSAVEIFKSKLIRLKNKTINC
jgi:hypothetical protein